MSLLDAFSLPDAMEEAPRLLGHEAAEEAFRKARNSGRMHHAWLICGPKGIGKAALALHFARQVLVPSGNRAALGRIDAGSHADLLVLSPPEDEEKDETKRDIPVEKTRMASEFLSLTPAEGDWRVVIVDSADEMNANAANALLKTLEEPPPRALLLLVSHNPGGLLATIRSRCRILKLTPLSAETFRQIMRIQAPDANEETIRQLGLLTHYSPGEALSLLTYDGIELYEKFVQMVGKGGDALAFAERLIAGQPHARWQVMARLAMRFFERTLEVGGKQGKTVEIVRGEGEACQTFYDRLSPLGVADLHARALEQFSVASRLHLDYKTAMITFLHSLKSVAA